MQNKKVWWIAAFAFLLGGLFSYFTTQYKLTPRYPEPSEQVYPSEAENVKNTGVDSELKKQSKIKSHSYQEIDRLTDEKVVLPYLKENGTLPDYYITKAEARQQGWNAGAGNLCEVLPGKAIGGDVWTNRQKSLPTAPGRRYYEADLNYRCGRRNADRVVFSNDGKIFVTHNHYQSFDEIQ